MHARELELVSTPASDIDITSASAPARQGSAILIAQQGRDFVLEAAPGAARFTARRALACLVEPVVGDRVWFAVEAGPADEAPAWLLSVLEREGPQATTTLSVEGDAELRAEGTLRVSARAGLELHSEQRVDVLGERLRVRARVGEILIGECTSILRTLSTHVTKSTLVGKVLETLTEQLTVHAKTSLRSVEELDQVQAGNIDYRAEDSAHIAAKHAMIKGGELVKVDAHQIHLG